MGKGSTDPLGEPLVNGLLDFFWHALPPPLRDRLFGQIVTPPTPAIGPWGSDSPWHEPVTDGTSPGVDALNMSPHMPKTTNQGPTHPEIPNPPGWTSKIPWVPPDPSKSPNRTPLPVPSGHGLLPNRKKMNIGGERGTAPDRSDDHWIWEKDYQGGFLTPAAMHTAAATPDIIDVLARAVHMQLRPEAYTGHDH